MIQHNVKLNSSRSLSISTEVPEAENKTADAKTPHSHIPKRGLAKGCYLLLAAVPSPTPGPWKGGQQFMDRRRGRRLRLPKGELIMNSESSLGGEGRGFLPS